MKTALDGRSRIKSELEIFGWMGFLSFLLISTAQGSHSPLGLSPDGSFSLNKSEYDQKCLDGKLLKLGAQRMVNADLSIEFLQRHYPKLSTTRIAVVDSGFDRNAADALVNAPDIQRAKVGKTGVDEMTHGTPVGGLINGKWGIGVNPWAQVVSIKLSEDGVFDGVGIARSLWKACREGAEIINVSLASDSQNFLSLNAANGFEFQGKPLIQHLAESGCLVIQAAGNSGFLNSVNKRDARSMKDKQVEVNPVLRVGGVDRFGFFSDSLTSGDLSAPAEDVLTITSSAYPEVKECYGRGLGLLSGTSFAAPIVSGIAGMTLSVLKTSLAFRRLPSQLRVGMLREILLDASKGGSVDALIAVRLADYLVKSREQSMDTFTNLRNGPKDFFWGMDREVGLASTTIRNPFCKNADGSDFRSMPTNQLRELSSLCMAHSALTFDLTEALQERNISENNWEGYFQTLWRSRIDLGPLFHKENFPEKEKERLLKAFKNLSPEQRLIVYKKFKDPFKGARADLEIEMKTDVKEVLLGSMATTLALDLIRQYDKNAWISKSQTEEVYQRSVQENWSADQLITVALLSGNGPLERVGALEKARSQLLLNLATQIEKRRKREVLFRGQAVEKAWARGRLFVNTFLLDALARSKVLLSDWDIAFILGSIREVGDNPGFYHNAFLALMNGPENVSKATWLRAVYSLLDSRWTLRTGQDSYVSFGFLESVSTEKFSQEEKSQLFRKVAKNWANPISAFSLVSRIHTIEKDMDAFEILDNIVEQSKDLLKMGQKQSIWGIVHVLRVLRDSRFIGKPEAKELYRKMQNTFPEVYLVQLKALAEGTLRFKDQKL